MSVHYQGSHWTENFGFIILKAAGICCKFPLQSAAVSEGGCIFNRSSLNSKLVKRVPAGMRTFFPEFSSDCPLKLISFP